MDQAMATDHEHYLVSDDVSYQKIWLELQALAWNNPDIRARLARVNANWRAVLTEASSSSAGAASKPGTASYWSGSTNGYRDDRAQS
jgi:hypothetical protein